MSSAQSTALARVSSTSTLPVATKAKSDIELLESWIASLGSQHTREKFSATAYRFLEALGCPMRQATVEEVRDAIDVLTKGLAASTARQYTLRVKGLLTYAHKLGYTMFNAGIAIRAPKADRALIKRIVSELDIRDLIRAAGTGRNGMIAIVFYTAGVRIAELVHLDCGDVITQPNGRVQLHVVGKGNKAREVLLPPSVGEKVLSFIGGRAVEAPLFATPRGGRLRERSVRHVIKKMAKKAKINTKLSPHWMRHAHASHALDRGASVAEVASNLGHESIATTSAYLHAKPGSSSGDKLDPDVWKDVGT